MLLKGKVLYRTEGQSKASKLKVNETLSIITDGHALKTVGESPSCFAYMFPM